MSSFYILWELTRARREQEAVLFDKDGNDYMPGADCGT